MISDFGFRISDFRSAPRCELVEGGGPCLERSAHRYVVWAEKT